MKKIFSSREYPGEVALFLLVLRIQIGLAFVFHGWPKIQDPFGWMGAGSGYSEFMLALAAIAEFVGGVCLTVGLVTRLSALGIACTMFVAMMHHMSDGGSFVGGKGSWELPALYLTLAVVFVFLGPGRSSVDAVIFKKKGG